MLKINNKFRRTKNSKFSSTQKINEWRKTTNVQWSRNRPWFVSVKRRLYLFVYFIIIISQKFLYQKRQRQTIENTICCVEYFIICVLG